MKERGNDHYCCQVGLQLQGFYINLIYMQRHVQTPANDNAWLLLIDCIPFYGMPFHVHRTSHIFKNENVRLSPLIKLWIIHKKHNHYFAYGSQAELSLAVLFQNEILLANSKDKCRLTLFGFYSACESRWSDFLVEVKRTRRKCCQILIWDCLFSINHWSRFDTCVCLRVQFP